MDGTVKLYVRETSESPVRYWVKAGHPLFPMIAWGPYTTKREARAVIAAFKAGRLWSAQGV